MLFFNFYELFTKIVWLIQIIFVPLHRKSKLFALHNKRKYNAQQNKLQKYKNNLFYTNESE